MTAAAATAGLKMEAGRKRGGGEVGCVKRRRRGEGPPCLHFVWNEEQDEGYVKDIEVNDAVCIYLYACVCPPLCRYIYLY